MTIAEAARLLGMSENPVREYRHSGPLVPVMIGNLHGVTRESVEQLLQRREARARAAAAEAAEIERLREERKKAAIPAENPRIEALAQATAKLTKALLRHYRERAVAEARKGAVEPLQWHNPEDWAGKDPAVVKFVDELVRDPVGEALRHGVKEIGRTLNDEFGYEGMWAAFVRARCLFTDTQYGPATNLVDRVWDGHGDWRF